MALHVCNRSGQSAECFHGCYHRDPHVHDHKHCLGGWCDGKRVVCQTTSTSTDPQSPKFIVGVPRNAKDATD